MTWEEILTISAMQISLTSLKDGCSLQGGRCQVDLKKTIKPSGFPLLIGANLSMPATISLQPMRDYRLKMLKSYV